jgi:hypothetical protein
MDFSDNDQSNSDEEDERDQDGDIVSREGRKNKGSDTLKEVSG